MKRENLTKEQQDYFMLGFQYGQRKSISAVKLAAIAGMVIMFLFGMMVPVRCNAQNPSTISKSKTVQQDTIPVSLLVRIQGRPWAFFHDGWEVRRKRNAPAYYHQYGDTIKLEPEPCKMIGCAASHFIISRTFPVDEFIGYLDSRKRPIRKEWVVYQTFKR